MLLSMLSFLRILLVSFLFSSVSFSQVQVKQKEVQKKEPSVRALSIQGVVQAPGILKQANQLISLSTENKEPITLIINSPGGEVFSGFHFINAMEVVKSRGVRLDCYVTGMAASMAFQFLAHCDRRFALPFSLLLWHPVRIGIQGILTPASAEGLTKELKLIESAMLPPLMKALDLDDSLFFEHYYRETFWTANSLMEISPNFLRIVRDIPVSLKEWFRVPNLFGEGQDKRKEQTFPTREYSNPPIN